MKTHRLALCAACVCALLASCTDRLPEPDQSSDVQMVPLELSVQASPATQTKGLIYGTRMPDGSCLGIAVTEPNLDTYCGETIMNVAYISSTIDGSQVWKPVDSPILLSTTVGYGYAYYPYSEDVTSLKEIPVKASSGHQVDYMYAKKVTNLKKSTPAANMTLNHALCAVRLSFIRGTYKGEGVITSASVKGAAE